jgi:signal transduction histidine kinase
MQHPGISVENDWLTASAPARDFGVAYLARKAELRIATDEAMAMSPAFGILMSTLSQAQHDATYEAYWRGIEGAFAGDWTARLAALVRTGIVFARAGADLFDWERLSAANTRVVREELFARYGTDHGRLLATLDVMQRFFDRSFCAFSEAYLAAAQDRVHQAEVMYRLSSFGQAVVDAQGMIHKPNDAFLALYGMSPRDAHDASFLGLFTAESLSDAKNVHFVQASETGRVGFDSIHVRADGTHFLARVEAVRIAQSARGPSWGVTCFDQTERRQVEAWRSRSAELEIENSRVRQASRAKSEFLANMSHELRTPLNSIIGFSQLLVAGDVGPLAAQQRDFLEDIHRSGKHLLRLINDVLDLSKVEAGKVEFFAEEVDLLALTQETVKVARGLLDHENDGIDVHVDDDARAARLDRLRFQQILLNFLSNALKFSAPTTRVRVEIRAEGSSAIRLSVRDEGIGIAPEDLPRLFRVFEQLDGSRTKRHGGTGLGLALTRQLVEAQGGSVDVDSTLGVGSTFHAILPRQPACAASSRPAAG